MNRKKIMALACMALAFFTAGTSMAVDNTGTGGVIMYTDSNGSNAVANPPYIGGYVVHTFTNSGTLNIPVPASADVLVVGGGGGGGGNAGGHYGGGGGAGGLIYTNTLVSAGQSVSVTVGDGGIANTPTGNNGSNSVFGSLTAIGGGGGCLNNLAAGAAGGSGGGGYTQLGGAAQQPGSGSGGFGNSGGYGNGSGAGGGGGGAGSVGASPGAGGVGLAYSISGTNCYYAGGGSGAGTATNVPGGGGISVDSGTAAAGAQNTGGGGGGGWGASGGKGGSGIVIVRYPYDVGLLKVSVTAPANNQQFLPGSSVTATVSVASGTMPYTVTFYTNGVSAWSSSASTNLFTIDLGTLADGTYTNYAMVTDSADPVATAFSVTNTFTVAPDTTPPTPNSMTFSVAPKGLTVTSVVMTATTATDTLSPPVYYFFENVSNLVDSGWVSSTVWTNTGLTLGTTYGYRVKARDSATTPNETGWSTELTALAFGGEYFVATNGSDTVNNGMSWASPFRTISNAVAKSDATIVTVSNGTYNITAQIVVGKALTVCSYGGGVYGGLANASNTVVQGPGGSISGPRIFSVTNAVAVLDGFTIRNGCGRGDYGWNGNGVYMANGCTVMNCIIKENGGATGYDHAKGGGVYMASGLLSNCIVRANKVNAGNMAGGGGIWAEGGQIVNCQIVANQNVAGELKGGGIYANNTQIINCQILNNTNSASSGGGISATSASTLIRNCLIVSNRTVASSTYGGGVYGGRIESSTIAGNSAANAVGTFGGGVYGSVVTNSIVWNNTTGSGLSPNYDPTSTFAYSCASPKPSGVGNVNSATFMNLAGGDYRLMPCPAVDSGTNLAWMAGALDLGGNPRTNGVNNRVDMGAYELVPSQSLVCGLGADVTTVVAPSNVVFTAFLDGTNQNITSYNWNFGDGQTAGGATLTTVTNTYSVAGLYTVTLTVTNDTGESAAATNTSYITVWGMAYVWTDSPSPSAPYHTWANAARTIADAVNAAPAGTTVIVTNGTYNITDQITVGKAITVCSYGGGVYGGLANASNTVVQRSGASAFRVVSVTNANAVLDGFTIRNGIGRGDSGWNGNGVYMANGCTVMNCIIKENGISGDNSFILGGGVYMASGTLSNCVVRGNITSYGGNSGGGGVYAIGGTIVNCQILANSCNGSAGGGGINAANTQILNCQILSNTNIGTMHGGGINANATSTLIRNCLIVSNQTTGASTYGGGVYGGRIESSTIAGNSAANAVGTFGGGVYGSVLTNSIVWNNTTGSGLSPNYDPTSTFAYSCASPKPSGVGNVNSATFMNLAGGDYRLIPCPAVDSGTNLAWMAGALDLGGNPRTNGVNNRVDMGAYELVPGGLQCGLAADAQSVVAPSNVVFTAFLTGTNKNITSYSWNFGDSQTASGSTLGVVTNTYSAAGLYTVTLSVANDAGENASVTTPNYITVFGANVYVWTNSPAPAAPYHTWANAAQSLYVAVNAAPAGSRVVVTNGTYNLGAQILVDKAITVCSYGGGVYGGLANASNTVVQRSSGTTRIFAVTNAAAVLDGFTIRNGSGRDTWHGLGVYMNNGCTVQNCIIKDNQSADNSWIKGGGVYMASGTLSNCLVVANKPTVNATGGGIWADGGQIVNCTVISNSCPGGVSGSIGGGGIVASSASVLIRNCLIVSNQVSGASMYGGGVYGGRIESSTIAGNSAANATGTSGGGVYGSVVTNSIVWNNTTGSGVGTNYGGTCTFGYSCTAPLPSGTGNIMSDPLFVNAAGGNYRLASKPPASPCNDKGMNLVWMTDAVDLGGNLRIQHDIVDMGAYESVFIPAGTVITFF